MINTGMAFTTGIGHPIFNDGVVVTAPPEKGSPADLAGIRKNDILIKVRCICPYMFELKHLKYSLAGQSAREGVGDGGGRVCGKDSEVRGGSALLGA